MRRRTLLALSLCLAFASAAPAAIKTSHFCITTGPKEYLQANLDEKLVLGKPSRLDETKRAPGRWLFEDGKIRCSVTGLHLTFDPKDREGKVFLAEKAVKGARWLSAQGKGRPKNHKEHLDAEWGVLEAETGPMKGCRLDAEVTEGKGGQKSVRLLLRKEPKRNVEIARLYTHR